MSALAILAATAVLWAAVALLGYCLARSARAGDEALRRSMQTMKGERRP